MREKTAAEVLLGWQNKVAKMMTGRSLGIEVFNKKFLVDLDFIQKRLDAEFPELAIAQKEVEKYEEWQLLPECHRDDGTRGYPLYTPLRISYIKQLIEKWQYTPTQLKYFTDFEEVLIDDVLTCDELDYSDLSDFEYWKALLKQEIRNDHHVGYENSSGTNREIKNRKQKVQQALEMVDGKKFGDLPEKLRDSIEENVLFRKFEIEACNLQTITEEHARALLGFSPNVYINMRGTQIGNEPAIGECDADATSCKYKIQGRVAFHMFGDWEMGGNDKEVLDSIKISLDAQLTLFAVPEFFVDFGENRREININIRDPKAVTTKYLRDLISKIYTCYRERIVEGRAAWGEKSGRKAKIQNRDKELKEVYRNLRNKAPNVRAERHQEKALEEIIKKYGPLGDISLERLQRIVYQKE